MDCLNGLGTSLQRRETNSETSSAKYHEVIIQAAQKVMEKQKEHEQALVLRRDQQSAMTSREWLITKRKLASERAAWANR
jgi:hypothetical protein